MQGSVGQRAKEVLRVLGGADPQGLRRQRQTLDKSVVDGVEHDHARAGRALLPLKAEGRIHDLRHGFVKVGVVVHDGGVLAAHFRDDPLDLPLARLHLGRLFHDVQAHIHRTGKADKADVRVFHQIVAHDGALAGAIVEDPGGEPHFLEDFHKIVADGRGQGRRLEHHRVPGDDCGRNHAHRNGEGEVPRRNDGGNALGVVEQDVVLAGRAAHAPGHAEAEHVAGVVFEEERRGEPLLGAARFELRIGEGDPDLRDLSFAEEPVDELDARAQESHVPHTPFGRGLGSAPHAGALDVDAYVVARRVAFGQRHGVFALAAAQLQDDRVVVAEERVVPMSLERVVAAEHLVEFGLYETVESQVFAEFAEFVFSHNRMNLPPCRADRG
mgnify:CR=1 FL=1